MLRPPPDPGKDMINWLLPFCTTAFAVPVEDKVSLEVTGAADGGYAIYRGISGGWRGGLRGSLGIGVGSCCAVGIGARADYWQGSFSAASPMEIVEIGGLTLFRIGFSEHAIVEFGGGVNWEHNRFVGPKPHAINWLDERSRATIGQEVSVWYGPVFVRLQHIGGRELEISEDIGDYSGWDYLIDSWHIGIGLGFRYELIHDTHS